MQGNYLVWEDNEAISMKWLSVYQWGSQWAGYGRAGTHLPNPLLDCPPNETVLRPTNNLWGSPAGHLYKYLAYMPVDKNKHLIWFIIGRCVGLSHRRMFCFWKLVINLKYIVNFFDCNISSKSEVLFLQKSIELEFIRLQKICRSV